MTRVNFHTYVNVPGAQLCLNFPKYSVDPQARLFNGDYLKAQKTLCYIPHRPKKKNGLRNLIFPKRSTFTQKNLCSHKGGWYELA